MPEIDLWRFVFPEHRLFVINRHAMGDDRTRIIQRGFFNGMGWVVWQDVFGLALPFTPAEAALLKRCRTILREQLAAINSPQPTPLLATGAPHVYANTFPAEHKQLWTLYNAADTPVHGTLLRVEPRAGFHFVDVWNNLPLDLDGDGGLTLTLAPRSVGAVVAFSQLLSYQPEHNTVVLNEALPDATIELRSLGQGWETSATARTFELPQANGQYIVRLVRDRELLDQLVIPNGETW